MPAPFLPLLLAALVLAVSAQGLWRRGRLTALSLSRDLGRASIGTNRPAAAYFTARNEGAADDVLKAIETPTTDTLGRRQLFSNQDSFVKSVI